MSTVESERQGLPRGAKIAIVSVAVLAVLAVAGAGTAWWLGRPDTSAEAVAPTPSASVTTSAGPSAEPTPAAAAPASALTDPAFRDGQIAYSDQGWGLVVTCGMPVDELTTHASAPDFQMTVAGPVAEAGDGYTLPVEVTRQGGDSGELYREPGLAWIQDGRVVDFTANWGIDAPELATLAAGESLGVDAAGSRLWGCGDVTDVLDDGALGTEPELLMDRPAGAYDVIAMMPVAQGILMSDPLAVTIAAPPPLTGSFSQGFSDDRTALGADVVCGMPVADLPESDARFTVDVVGSPSFESPHWKLPIHVASSGGAGEGERVSAVLLWVQDGAVVDLGSADTHFAATDEWAAGGPEFPGGSHDDVAVGSAVDTCMPEADGTTFRSYRPAGDYEVIPFVRLGNGDDAPIVLGDPVPVTVGERGRP